MNQRIDHTNYEAWLLDRLEGNLTPEQGAQLDAFLAANPELAPIDNGLPSIKAADLPSFDKDLLKRSFPPHGSATAASIDDHLIARLEGDLSREQLLALEKFLYEHPEYANADRFYALTRLVPQAMAFAAKQDLERQLPPEGLVTKYTLLDHLVARLEGDLSDRQEQALTSYLKHDPQAERAWRIMARTKIPADPVIYSQKGGLKKGGRVIAISFQRTAIRFAAAASVAVLLGLALWSVIDGTDRNSGTLLVQDPTPEKAEVKQGVPDAKVGQERSSESGTSVPVIESQQEEPSIATDTDQVPSTNPAKRSSPESPKPGPIPIERNIAREKVQFAEQLKVVPSFDRPEAEPIAVQVIEVPVNFDQEQLAEMKIQEVERGNSIGTLVASAVREKVLEQPSADPRPLDRNDAVAAVDKGLKAISGEKAGLDVQRTKGGKIRNFNLRVGDFALTASTGN